MKASLVAAVLSALPTAVVANSMECMDSLVASPRNAETAIDLYPHKVAPLYSEYWDVEYHGTYKVLTNKAVNATYLLYQCGSEIPEGTYDNAISVPLEHGVNIATTPMISFLEMLGLRMQIKGFLSYEAFVSSPCLVSLIDEGLVGSEPSTDNATLLAAAGIDTEDALTLAGGWFTSSVITNTMLLHEASETTFAGTMEWIKVYAALFNQEELANQVFDAAVCRFGEIANNVASVTADMPTKPTVLWAYYSEYCGGWSVASCPNYYCEFAEACRADMLNATDAGSVLTSGCPPSMTNEEFAEFGKDADHWIYPSGNWNEMYAANEEFLSQFASVQNSSVYDYQGSGENNWFEQRYAEYDLVLNDFCLVAGTVQSTAPSNRRYWFRNVFTEPVGNMGECTDPTAPLEPRGNSYSECAASIIASSSQPTEDIPVDDEKEPSEGVEEEDMTTIEESAAEEDHSDDHDHDYNHDHEDETEEEKVNARAPVTSAGNVVSGAMALVSSLAALLLV